MSVSEHLGHRITLLRGIARRPGIPAVGQAQSRRRAAARTLQLHTEPGALQTSLRLPAFHLRFVSSNVAHFQGISETKSQNENNIRRCFYCSFWNSSLAESFCLCDVEVVKKTAQSEAATSDRA